MPSPFGDVPVAKSLLDFQRVLSPNAGVRVSPLCLGAMNFGDAWSGMMGHCDKKTTFEILDYFHEQGGNFIDTLVFCIIPYNAASGILTRTLQGKQLPERRI
jgi:predicted aldo/keto reductase-like oxidoreductase